MEKINDFDEQLLSETESLRTSTGPAPLSLAAIFAGLAACVLMALFGMKIVMHCAPVLSTLKETFAPVVELAPNLAWAFAAVLGGLGLSFFLRHVARYSH